METDAFWRKLELHHLEATVGRRAVPLFIRVLLEDDSPMVRRTAAEVLGRIGDRRAVEPLLRRLSDCPDRLERTAVVEALGRLAPCRTVLERLLPIMEGDSRAEVRRAAADAVVRFAWALGDGKALVRAARVFPETVRRVLGLAAQQKRPLSGAQKGLLLLLWKHPDLQHDDRLRFYIERLLKAPDKEREIHLSI